MSNTELNKSETESDSARFAQTFSNIRKETFQKGSLLLPGHIHDPNSNCEQPPAHVPLLIARFRLTSFDPGVRKHISERTCETVSNTRRENFEKVPFSDNKLHDLNPNFEQPPAQVPLLIACS